MPIFTRRRLQAMLDELGPLLTKPKTKDLLSRLEHRDTANAMSAEAELGLLWALRQVSHIVIEPELPGTSARIDAIAHHLLPNASMAVEITALSDDTFSGRKDMDRTANIICGFANRTKKGAGKHLYFEFGEGRVKDGYRSKRVRFVDPAYELTAEHEDVLRTWIKAPNWPDPDHLVLQSEKTLVRIRWQKFVHPHGRVFCSMPPVAYDLEDNPLFKALEEKERQMSGIHPIFNRAIFVADAGSNLLWSSRQFGGGVEKRADDIVHHFLAGEDRKTDFVCLFSPQRAPRRLFERDSDLQWRASLFARASEVQITPAFEALAGALPAPQFEGYQARQRHKQGSFSPQGRGHYLPTIIESTGGAHMSVKISARLVHEFMAGRIDRERFQREAFGRDDFNYFESQLARGNMIHAVRFNAAGLDEDDDYLVFELADDVTGAMLRAPLPGSMRRRFDAWISRLLLSLRVNEARARDNVRAERAKRAARRPPAR